MTITTGRSSVTFADAPILESINSAVGQLDELADLESPISGGSDNTTAAMTASFSNAPVTLAAGGKVKDR